MDSILSKFGVLEAIQILRLADAILPNNSMPNYRKVLRQITEKNYSKLPNCRII